MTDWWAFGVAGAALLVSAGTGWYNRRSANSAERSETTAKLSVKVAEEARDEARRSADAAEAVHKLERDRNHEMFKPRSIQEDFTIENYNGDGLWCTFTLDRDYNIHFADRIEGASRSPLHVTVATIQAGLPVKVFVGALPPAPAPSLVQHLEFGLAPAGYDCLCGRDGNRPHWVYSVKVVTPPRKNPPATYRTGTT